MARSWAALSPTYRARLERHGVDRATYEAGVSLGAARGHAPFSGGGSPALHREDVIDRAAKAADDVGRGMSLEAAAKKHHLAPEQLRAVAHEHGYLGKTYNQAGKGGRWALANQDTTTMRVVTTDGAVRDLDADLFNRRQMGKWGAALDALLNAGDAKPMARLHRQGLTVQDRAGRSYTLLTEPNALLRWWNGLSDAERRRFDALFYVRKRAA